MTLKTLYVLGHEVDVEGAAAFDLPYQFQAVETIKFTGDLKNAEKAAMYNASEVFVVNIVMPVGGSQSALFRYPQEGEKVLAGIEDSNLYLMGYLPEKRTDENSGQDDIFTDSYKDYSDIDREDPIVNGQILPNEKAGMFFRYKGQDDYTEKADRKGKKVPIHENYSELGFYTEKTKWTRDGKTPEKGKTPYYPSIDTLKISSTGDINQKAANHNQIKAKRFELLVDCDSSKNSDKESKRDFAFGDTYGDDSNLYAGDAHIRAKNRVIIKAEKEILFEVGRSIISITDEGMEIMSRKSRANIHSGWDSSVSIDPYDGVMIRGKRVSCRGVLEVEMSEAYGGYLKSETGILRIQGKDVGIATMSTKRYAWMGGLNVADSAVNAAQICAGLGLTVESQKEGASSEGSAHEYSSLIAGDILNFVSTKVLRLWGPTILEMIFGGSEQHYFTMKHDWAWWISKVRLIIWIMCIGVRYLLMFTVPDKIQRNPTYRDSLALAFAAIEHGAALAACAAYSVAYSPGMIHHNVLHLHGSGQFTTDSQHIRVYTNEDLDAKSPVAALADKKENVVGKTMEKATDGVKGLWGSGWKAQAGMVIGGIALAALAGGAAAGAYFGAEESGLIDWVTGGKDDKLMEELRSL